MKHSKHLIINHRNYNKLINQLVIEASFELQCSELTVPLIDLNKILDTKKMFDMVILMKRLSAFVVIIMLFATSIASAANASCADDKSSNSSHMSQSIDNSNSQDDNSSLAYDCSGCGCSHHMHSKMPLAANNLDELITTSKVAHNWDDDIYHSELYNHISKPPKA